jgi:hypothetical protein
LTKPNIFSAMTGNTHGMTFNISPPKKANNSIVARRRKQWARRFSFRRRRRLDGQRDFNPLRLRRTRMATRTPVIWSGQTASFLVTILRNRIKLPAALATSPSTPSTEKLVLAAVGIKIRRRRAVFPLDHDRARIAHGLAACQYAVAAPPRRAAEFFAPLLDQRRIREGLVSAAMVSVALRFSPQP